MPFPRMHAYLESLPDGWASFPECTAKATLLEGVGSLLPEPDRARLPALLRERLADRAVSTAWAPEVEQIALLHAVWDARAATPDGEQTLWAEITRSNVELFRRREYRPLIAHRRPGRLLEQVGGSWHRFHLGTELACLEASEQHAVLELTYPAPLFPPLALSMRRASLAGVLIASEAADAEIEMETPVPGRTRYRVAWGS